MGVFSKGDTKGRGQSPEAIDTKDSCYQLNSYSGILHQRYGTFLPPNGFHAARVDARCGQQEPLLQSRPHRYLWHHHPINGEPATFANGGTIGFAMQSPEQADAFHAAGVANGGVTCEDPPGWREGPGGKLYLAYLRDPDGNKICALHRPAKDAAVK